MIVMAGIWWARRGEFSLYRIYGASRANLALMMGYEELWLLIVPFHIGMTGAITLLTHNLSDLTSQSLLFDMFRTTAAFSLIPLIGLLVTTTTSPLNNLKETT
jgi:hypothetical protein